MIDSDGTEIKGKILLLWEIPPDYPNFHHDDIKEMLNKSLNLKMINKRRKKL